MKLRIIPYKMSSSSAKNLAKRLTEKLGYKVWRSGPKAGAYINLCWGYSKPVTEYDLERFINFPPIVAAVRDKALAFKQLEIAGVSHVPYTTAKEVAEDWLKKGKTVLARSVCGQGGSGIKVWESDSGPLPEAPLYTQYVKKKQEFRVHVYMGDVICVQEKRKRKNEPVGNKLIRSHRHGWIFCLQDINEPDGLRVLGVDAVRACGLDFGAVDIIYNEHYNKLYVLEINSAPGLEGTTLEAYANAICSRL